MYFIALGAVALAVGAAWFGRSRVTVRVVSALLVVEAIALVVTTSVEWTSIGPLVISAIATLVTSLATTAAVCALAFAWRTPISRLAAACWVAWWVAEAVLYIWIVDAAIRGPSEPPDLGFYPCMLGFLAAGFVVAAVHGSTTRIPAMVVVLVAFVIAWMVGRVWLADPATVDDPDEVRSVHQFINVGYVGWHVMLATLLWRSGASKLPPARVVKN